MRLRLSVFLTFAAAAGLAQQKPCPTDVFLDVSQYEGAGAEYPKPRLEAACEGDELVVRSNGIPHYEFIQVTPNPLLEQDYEFRVPLNPKKADKPTPHTAAGQRRLSASAGWRSLGRMKARFRKKPSSAIR